MIETLMLIGLFLFAAYTLVLVAVVLYDVLTGRIDRLRGIAHKNNRSARPLSAQNEG